MNLILWILLGIIAINAAAFGAMTVIYVIEKRRRDHEQR